MDIPIENVSPSSLSIHDLTTDALLAIFSHFGLAQLIHLRAVCTTWRDVIEQHILNRRRSIKIFIGTFNESVLPYVEMLHHFELHRNVKFCLQPIGQDDELTIVLTTNDENDDDYNVQPNIVANSDLVKQITNWLIRLFGNQLRSLLLYLYLPYQANNIEQLQCNIFDSLLINLPTKLDTLTLCGKVYTSVHLLKLAQTIKSASSCAELKQFNVLDCYSSLKNIESNWCVVKELLSSAINDDSSSSLRMFATEHLHDCSKFIIPLHTIPTVLTHTIRFLTLGSYWTREKCQLLPQMFPNCEHLHIGLDPNISLAQFIVDTVSKMPQLRTLIIRSLDVDQIIEQINTDNDNDNDNDHHHHQFVAPQLRKIIIERVNLFIINEQLRKAFTQWVIWFPALRYAIIRSNLPRTLKEQFYASGFVAGSTITIDDDNNDNSDTCESFVARQKFILESPGSIVMSDVARNSRRVVTGRIGVAKMSNQ